MLRAVRDRVSKSFAAGARTLADECIAGGSSVSDAAWFAVELGRAGLDFLSLSRGGKFDDAMLVAGAQADTTSMRYLLPEEVARLVRIAIEENELYIFTHPELAAPARMRFDEIAKGYARLSERIS